MSKPVKEMIVSEYKRRFQDVNNALIIDIRGIEANTNNELRVDLLRKDIRITVLKNSLARKAFEDTALEPLSSHLDGPAALAFGGDSVVEVARNLVTWAKKITDLELKAAVLDGERFDGAEGVKRLSEFPTKDEAQATVVQLVLSPGGRVVAGATAPGSGLAGIIKELGERLERGEAMERIA
jgi:large subunit ribosomal protein L10